MNMTEYQVAARRTAVYPKVHQTVYPALGLAGEAGEVANKVKKILRGDPNTDIDAIAHELGDVLWYVANLAYDLGLSLDDIAVENIAMLGDRQARNMLKGSGDNR